MPLLKRRNTVETEVKCSQNNRSSCEAPLRGNVENRSGGRGLRRDDLVVCVLMPRPLLLDTNIPQPQHPIDKFTFNTDGVNFRGSGRLNQDQKATMTWRDWSRNGRDRRIGAVSSKNREVRVAVVRSQQVASLGFPVRCCNWVWRS